MAPLSSAPDDPREPSLDALGLGEPFSSEISRMGAELGLTLPGRVVGMHRREWDVTTEDGTERAVLAGKRWSHGKATRRELAQPTVGDWVLLRRDGTAGRPVIEHVLTRRTVLYRSAVARRGESQAIAANLDLVAVVVACAHPGADDRAALRSTNPRRIERYLTAVRSGGAEAVVLLNKADLDPESESRAKDLEARLGATVLAVDVVRENGIFAFERLLRPKSTVGLVGLSGVGKSSIVNRLIGRDAQRVAEERSKDARGRHTTTHRELFVAPSGVLLIDTPGMREFGLGEAGPEDLEAFEDVIALARECRFRDCTHGAEPGCVAKAAVRSGRLSEDRLESYRALLEELKEKTAPENRLRKARGGGGRPRPDDGGDRDDG